MKNRRSKIRLGVLMLIASWCAGSFVANAQQAPIIAAQPKSQSATNGNNVTFSVTATGSNPLRYQWSFASAPITGATNSALTLTNVQCSSARTYFVVVTNNSGSITSSNAVLTVIDTVPPAIACAAAIHVLSFAELPPPDPSFVTATDLCSNVIITNLGDSFFTNGTDVTVSRLWRATDTSGNSTQCMQTIVINSNCVPAQVVSFQFHRDRTETGYLASADAVVSGTSPFFYFACFGPCTNFLSYSTSLHIGPLFEPFEDQGPAQGLFITNACGVDGGVVAPSFVFILTRGNPTTQSGQPNSFGGPVLTNPCGILGTTSLWFNLQAMDGGIADISTDGCPDDTIMGVYTGSVSTASSLQLIACNNDVSASVKQSRLQFQVNTNLRYYLVVDGVRTQSTFRLAFGLEPRLEPKRLSGPVRLELSGSPAPALSYSLQASTNLTNWTTLANTNFAPLATNAGLTELTNTVFYFQDATFPSFARRFYRIVPGQ